MKQIVIKEPKKHTILKIIKTLNVRVYTNGIISCLYMRLFMLTSWMLTACKNYENVVWEQTKLIGWGWHDMISHCEKKQSIQS